MPDLNMPIYGSSKTIRCIPFFVREIHALQFLVSEFRYCVQLYLS